MSTEVNLTDAAHAKAIADELERAARAARDTKLPGVAAGAQPVSAEPVVDVEIGARGFADTKVRINGHEVHPSSVKVEISAKTSYRPIVTLVFARRVRFEVAAKAICNLMAAEEEGS